MKELALSGFDYASLTPTAARIVKAATAKLRLSHAELTAQAIDIGRILTEVKEVLEHGEFGKWLIAEFGWSDRSARRYMLLASAYGSKTDSVSELPITILHRLAAPTISASVRDEVLLRIENGERPTTSNVSRLIAAAAPPAEQTDKQQRAQEAERQAKARAREDGADGRDLRRDDDAAEPGRNGRRG
jgi:Protein of unknown function (DUF3102)